MITRDPLFGYALVGASLVAANVLNNELAPEAYLPVCIVTTVVLITLARLAGCTWDDLGLARRTAARGLAWGGLALAIMLAGYAAAAVLPELRVLLADRRVAPLEPAEVMYKAFVWVPFGTVLLEETAFRGVVYGLARRRYGTRAAVVASSALFGLWHLLPARGIATTNPALAATFGGSPAGRAAAAGLAIAGAALAGVVFCELRRRSGSILAPMVAHWATNGLGYLASHAVARLA